MLLPYRAKNPPETFPIVTISLIALNTLVYAFTSDSLLVVNEHILQQFGVTHNNMFTEPWRIVTAMFLHASPLHLIGNMLFLWLFGAATEGRLKPGKFLFMYLAAGVCGSLVEDVVWGLMNPDAPSLGASGAIMGVAGAYLFLFPYSHICVLCWFGFYYSRVHEWQARWVVLMYLGMDIFEALIFRGGDGVGHLAHIGGAVAGIGIVALMRTRRDTEEISDAMAIQADTKDYTLLSRSELMALMQKPTVEADLIIAYLEKEVPNYHTGYQTNALEVLGQFAPQLLDKADPERLARIILHIPPRAGGLNALLYLKLGSILERGASFDTAMQIYRRQYDLNPYAPETETALFRIAHLLEGPFANRQQAMAVYQEMLRLFPNGSLAINARDALMRG